MQRFTFTTLYISISHSTNCNLSDKTFNALCAFLSAFAVSNRTVVASLPHAALCWPVFVPFLFPPAASVTLVETSFQCQRHITAFSLRAVFVLGYGWSFSPRIQSPGWMPTYYNAWERTPKLHSLLVLPRKSPYIQTACRLIPVQNPYPEWVFKKYC